MKLNNNSITVSEAAKLLNYKSNQGVIQLIDLKVLPNAYKKDGKWRIPIVDIKNVSKIYENSIGTNEAKRILGYKNTGSIVELIEKSRFPNAFQFLRKWRIPLSDIENIEKNDLLDLTIAQATETLKINRNAVLELLNSNTFPNAYKDFVSKWKIPLADIKEYQKEHDYSDYVDIQKACNFLEAAKSTIYYHLSAGRFPNSFKYGKKWLIHTDDLNDFKKNYEINKIASKPSQNRKSNHKSAISLWDGAHKKDYISVRHASEKLNLTKHSGLKLFQRELPNGLIEYRGRYWVSKSIFDNYLNIKLKNINNSLTTKEAAKRLGYAHAANISILIKNKQLLNAFKIGKRWYIPIKDIEQYEHKKELKNGKKVYTPKIAYHEIEQHIYNTKIGHKIVETRDLFNKFCVYKINNTKGSTTYFRSRIQLFKLFYTKLISNLSDEVFNLSTEEINDFLGGTSSFTKAEKKILIVFLRYVYHQKEITPESEFSLNTSDYVEKDKEIYSLDLFNEIYKYSKDIKAHLPIALEKRNHANMWTYTILLLTDFIRGQDLILNTPNIDIESIGVTSMDYFKKHELSNTQVEIVIKQLYVHFRRKRSSKTNELLTFIVSPDLKESLAYSLVVSEIHRRNEDSDLLLGTFLVGQYSLTKTAGKMSHKNFFNNLDNNLHFKFSSRKMNNSVATYLFYSITEEDGPDSDLALHLTQVSRSHKSSDSTSRYIQATNKDGTINRVSYNLFRRGHFGWLYNYLLIYINHDESIQHSMEERTQLIEETKDKLSLKLLEDVARYSLQSTVPVKENNQTMEKFTQDLYEKKKNIISRLQSYSKNEVREILYKMSKGELPSKNEHAQCLVAPECMKPHLSNCFSCEYVIPGNMMLIQLQEEIQRLIKSIKETNIDIEVKRDTKFLLHSLMIWKEARIAFGEDRVNAYIPLESVWEDIHGISDKLVLK